MSHVFLDGPFSFQSLWKDISRRMGDPLAESESSPPDSLEGFRVGLERKAQVEGAVEPKATIHDAKRPRTEVTCDSRAGVPAVTQDASGCPETQKKTAPKAGQPIADARWRALRYDGSHLSLRSLQTRHASPARVVTRRSFPSQASSYTGLESAAMKGGQSATVGCVIRVESLTSYVPELDR